MSEQSEGNREPPAEETAMTLDWRTAVKTVRTLRPGDMVTGIDDLSELDIVANNFGRVGLQYQEPDFDKPQTFRTNTGDTRILGWYGQAKPPSEIMKPRYGKLKDISILMLDDIPGSQEGETPLQSPRKRFVMSGDVEVTGKGTVKQTKLCTLRGMVPKLYGKLIVPTQISASYKNLSANNPDAAAEIILADSRTSAEKVIRYGLRRLYSAGRLG